MGDENFAADAGKGDLFSRQLLQWLAHWGDESRLQPAANKAQHHLGQLAELTEAKVATNASDLPEGHKVPVQDAVFFTGRPTLVLWNPLFLRNCPPASSWPNGWSIRQPPRRPSSQPGRKPRPSRLRWPQWPRPNRRIRIPVCTC